jgi:signal transduction histidine kinase
LCRIEKLDGIVELTGDEEVLMELFRYRPPHVGVLEYQAGTWLKDVFDINQRIRSEEQQVILETMSSDFLIQKSTAGIMVLNPDLTIFDANEVFLNEVGKTKKEVIGAYCYEISHNLKAPCSEVQSELACPVLETLRTGKSAHAIHEHSYYDSGDYFCNLVTYPIKNQDGEITRVIKIRRDITQAVASRWEQKIQALKEDINRLIQEDRMISLGRLVASSAHEINNPIQGLLTFSHLIQDILNDGQTDNIDLEKIKKHIAMMSQELERCGNIVSGLLSFARESPVEYVKTDLNEVINAVISLIRHKIELHDIALKMTLSAAPILICGDANQLQQCFLNLIFNAIEAIKIGGEIEIHSEIDTAGKMAFIRIEDTGCGINKKDIDHIFDPFFTTKPEGEGTGLGLSIVYGIVKNHKGNIRADSREGQGSSFKLVFPIQ